MLKQCNTNQLVHKFKLVQNKNVFIIQEKIVNFTAVTTEANKQH